MKKTNKSKMKNINRYKDWAMWGTADHKKKIKFKGVVYDVQILHYRDKEGRFKEEVFFKDKDGVLYDLKPAIYG